MSLVLIRPGNRTPQLNLQKVLRDRHEEFRAAVDRRIAARKANGATDAVNFDAARKAVDAGLDAVVARDAAGARKAAVALLDATAEVIEPLAEYVPDPVFDAVDAVFVALRDDEREELIATVAVAGINRRIAGEVVEERARIAAVVEADKALSVAKGQMVKRAVSWLRVGGDTFAAVDDAVVDALAATGKGILDAVYVAARDYQGLGSPNFAVRSGS